jgi:hypothetical protein
MLWAWHFATYALSAMAATMSNAGSTAAAGAVLFACAPSLIASRRCRLTYGVETSRAAVPGDREDYTYMHREKQVNYCRNVFSRMVSLNQSVDVGEVVEHRFWALYKDQDAVAFRLFATQKEDGQYITDQGMRRIAELSVDLSDQVARGVDATTIAIEVQLHFGSTELTYSAVDSSTGKAVKTQVRYD